MSERTFQDAAGREWDLTLTFGDILRVKDDCDFDLLSVLEEDLSSLAELHDNLALRFRVIESLCRPQYEPLSISDVQFAMQIDGPTLGKALESLIAALDFFFQTTGRTAHFQKVVNRLKSAAETLMETLSSHCESLDDESLRRMATECVGSTAD